MRQKRGKINDTEGGQKQASVYAWTADAMDLKAKEESTRKGEGGHLWVHPGTDFLVAQISPKMAIDLPEKTPSICSLTSSRREVFGEPYLSSLARLRAASGSDYDIITRYHGTASRVRSFWINLNVQSKTRQNSDALSKGYKPVALLFPPSSGKRKVETCSTLSSLHSGPLVPFCISRKQAISAYPIINHRKTRSDKVENRISNRAQGEASDMSVRRVSSRLGVSACPMPSRPMTRETPNVSLGRTYMCACILVLCSSQNVHSNYML